MKEGKIYLQVAKIGLLGDSSVGKNSICQSYVGLEFNQTYLLRLVVINLNLDLS